MKTKVALLVAAVLTSSFAIAEKPSAEQRAVDVRRAVFKLIATNNAPIGAMIRGRADFDEDLAIKNLTRVSQLSLMIEDLFEKDTRDADVVTEAVDTIWENQNDFNAKTQDLTDAVNNALEELESGDEKSALSAMRKIGRTCGGCHDDYREEHDH